MDNFDSIIFSSLLLLVLIILSTFFAASETGIISLNRYRLRHLVKQGNKSAKRVSLLLARPDRLIGVILIGNNFVNILASAIATIIAVRLWGDIGVVIAATSLTIIMLIFCEVTPKTLASLYPEKIAFPASYVLIPLLKLFYPLVWAVNGFTNLFVKLLGVELSNKQEALSSEELRTVVQEAGALIPQRHQDMLLSILDLENVTVDDIMVPRHEIVGLDLDQDIDSITQQLQTSQHTRLPVYKTDINDVVGIIHLRNATRFLTLDAVTKEQILRYTRAPYFVPLGTPLHTQLLNFQKEKRRIGLVVDEYGDIQGIITLEDILEEIVGEFTTDIASSQQLLSAQTDSSYIIDASAHLRHINRILGWSLPTEGPKTLNGLLTEYLEDIPDANVCLQIENYQIEILQIKDNMIKTARIFPTTFKNIL